jgi:hypothetical protein
MDSAIMSLSIYCPGRVPRGLVSPIYIFSGQSLEPIIVHTLDKDYHFVR